LPEAIGLSDELKDVPFACQPIQQGGRHNFIPKNAIPVSKTQIRSDDDRYPFVEVRAELKKGLQEDVDAPSFHFP